MYFDINQRVKDKVFIDFKRIYVEFCVLSVLRQSHRRHKFDYYAEKKKRQVLSYESNKCVQMAIVSLTIYSDFFF